MDNTVADQRESQEEPGTVSSSSSYHVDPRPPSQLTPLTAASTSAVLDTPAAYCQAAVTSFAHDVSEGQYYQDYDWSQQPGLPVSDTHGAYYGFAERPELVGAGPTCAEGGVPLYSGFPSAEFYAGATSAALWGHHHPQHYHPHSLPTSRHHHQLQQHLPPPHPALAGEDPYHATLTSPYLPALTSRGSGATSGASSSSSSSSSSGKPKRRRVQSLPQRKAANIRERRRMFHLNTAFDELRKRLPAFNYEKRLSRIETLRLAMTYIGFMKDVTMGQDPHKVKLKTGALSDAASDLSHVDLESCTSDDHTDDLDC